MSYRPLSERVFYWPSKVLFEKDRRTIAASIKDLEDEIVDLKNDVKELDL